MSLLVAIHDVAPATLEAVSSWRHRMASAGVGPVTLLVVPDHHRRGRAIECAATVRWLRRRVAAGDEIALHGHYHLESRRGQRWSPVEARARAGSAGEAECLFQSPDERERMLTVERGLLERAVGAPLRGFVAPAWLEPRGMSAALGRAGFDWHEGATWIEDLVGEVPIRIVGPALGAATRTAARRLASRVYLTVAVPAVAAAAGRGLAPARIALHPADLDRPRTAAVLERAAARLAAALPSVTMSQFLRSMRSRRADAVWMSARRHAGSTTTGRQ